MLIGHRLQKRIRKEGPIPFSEFQTAALYDPREGYYERPGRIGKEGDFITGSSWHPAFARCLARLLETTEPGPDGVRRFLDAGCGEGQFLEYLAKSIPSGARVELMGVERSHNRRAIAAQRLPEARFFSSLEEAGEIHGVIVAYELIDALPVRSFQVSAGGETAERLVGLDAQGSFTWVTAVSDEAASIGKTLEDAGIRLEPGQIFEIRPGARQMTARLARALVRGVLLIFDYGAPARALYGPVRQGGTLEAFLGHHVTRDVLADPGSRDITAWVDFTELETALRIEGLTVAPLMSQSRFLISMGITSELSAPSSDGSFNPQTFNERQALLSLFAPGGMGESIRLLPAFRDCPGAREALELSRQVPAIEKGLKGTGL